MVENVTQVVEEQPTPAQAMSIMDVDSANTTPAPAAQEGVHVGENVFAETAESAPATPQPAQENQIPYSRFKEVIDQRNQYADQVAQYQEALQSTSQQAQGTSSFETVDDLLSHVNSLVDNKLNEAYSTKVAPLANNIDNMTFGNKVESYFSSSPDKAQVRAQMDAYTATMLPHEQEALKQSVLQGRYDLLDTIYYRVAAEQQNNVNQMTQDSVQQQAAQATQPEPYRVVRTVEPSLQDKMQAAKETGNWGDVFASFVPSE